MQTVNKRFPEMWKIISDKVNFKSKTVIDIGCGGGDFVKAVYDAGASEVYGFDLDVSQTAKRFDNNVPKNVYLCRDDINEWNRDWPQLKFHLNSNQVDILSCFSVLPYTNEPERLVRLFRDIARVVLIEMQYRGDGPGHLIRNDKEMEIWLKKRGYDFVENIGKTFVSGRDKYRTIWMCR